MKDVGKFSKRNHFYETQAAPITIYADAPEGLRVVIVEIAYDCGLSPKLLRTLVCRELNTTPDANNWSDPYVDNEVRELLNNCDWYKVYDVIERIAGDSRALTTPTQKKDFHDEINEYFIINGIAWELNANYLSYRGTEELTHVWKNSVNTLVNTDYNTAASEMHEAIKDLSRRPPDITGAIQHAMASLECVARDITGSKDTLGTLIKKNKNLFPSPINILVDKAWGYSSEYGRHVQEGRPPSLEEAELLLGISATLSNYLAKKSKQSITSNADLDLEAYEIPF